MLQQLDCLNSGCFAKQHHGYLQDDVWECGRISHGQSKKGKIWTDIRSSLANKPASMARLYLKDGTFPGELPEGCLDYNQVPGQQTPAVAYTSLLVSRHACVLFHLLPVLHSSPLICALCIPTVLAIGSEV